MNLRHQTKRVILLTLLILAGFLRFYRLDQIPPGLHRDEASTGWNAYSILLTNRDEHQQRWPLVFEAFGDWKRPLNIYLTAALIPIFGLNTFSVRAPIGVLGSLSVLLIYLVTRELLLRIKDEPKLPERHWLPTDQVPLLTALLLAISPWHIYMSRTGLGWNVVGLFLTLLAIYFYLIAKEKIWLMMASAFLFGLTLFSYASNQIFTPLFVFALLLVDRRRFKNHQRYLLPAAVFGLFLVAFLKIYYPVFQVNAVGSGLLDRVSTYQLVTVPQSRHPGFLVARFFHNRVLIAGLEFGKNYLRVLSPEFLFFNDRDNPAYSLKNFGQLYLFEFPLIIIGLGLIWQKSKDVFRILLAWLLIGVVPAALTRTPYSSTRSILILPVLLIAVAQALIVISTSVKASFPRLLRLTTVGMVGLYLGFFLLFLDEYFIHFPINRAGDWGKGKEEIVSYLRQHQAEYDQILIAAPEESFYIYLLYYLKIEPRQFWNQREYYPRTADGFQHVKSLGKYRFKEMNYPQDLQLGGRLVVDKTKELSLWLGDDRVKVMKEIVGPDGQSMYLIVAVN